MAKRQPAVVNVREIPKSTIKNITALTGSSLHDRGMTFGGKIGAKRGGKK